MNHDASNSPVNHSSTHCASHHSPHHSPFCRSAGFVGGAFLIGLGLVLSAYLVSQSIADFRRGERSVVVKGLVERNVQADFVQYGLNFVATGDNLNDVYAKIRADQATVTSFVKQAGIEESDISVGLNVSDTQAQTYRDAPASGPRYVINGSVTVNTGKVKEAAALTQKVGELIQGGVVLTGDGMLNYRFQGLNALKPDMLREATQNAREAAGQFARDAESHIGSIKRASQGVFSINATGQDYDNGTAMNKTVRVVTTVEYFLED